MVTTTHDVRGAGRPRLIFSMGAHGLLPEGAATVQQGEFLLHDGTTKVGSGDAADLQLDGIDDFHAEIVHDEFDEYVFVQRSDRGISTINGERMGRRPLRTGDRVELGPWMLSYFREEYADHGRPFGGRAGGEGAVQADQPPRSEIDGVHEPTVADLRTVVEGTGVHPGREATS